MVTLHDSLHHVIVLFIFKKKLLDQNGADLCMSSCWWEVLGVFVRFIPKQTAIYCVWEGCALLEAKKWHAKCSKEPWYHCQPVGKHKLSGMVAQMCEEAGLSERKTNHSLCVTGATSLYNGGVPEWEIQQRTGHRSIEALRKYERTGEEQHQAVSSMLSSPVELPYSSHLVPVCCTSTPSDPQESSSVSLPQICPPVSYHGPSVSSHSVRNQYSVQCPPGLNLQSLFQASGGGTLNINPHGNFVLNVQFGNRSQSKYDNCQVFWQSCKRCKFWWLLKDFELQKCMY